MWPAGFEQPRINLQQGSVLLHSSGCMQLRPAVQPAALRPAQEGDLGELEKKLKDAMDTTTSPGAPPPATCCAAVVCSCRWLPAPGLCCWAQARCGAAGQDVACSQHARALLAAHPATACILPPHPLMLRGTPNSPPACPRPPLRSLHAIRSGHHLCYVCLAHRLDRQLVGRQRLPPAAAARGVGQPAGGAAGMAGLDRPLRGRHYW